MALGFDGADGQRIGAEPGRFDQPTRVDADAVGPRFHPLEGLLDLSQLVSREVDLGAQLAGGRQVGSDIGFVARPAALLALIFSVRPAGPVRDAGAGSPTLLASLPAGSD